MCCLNACCLRFVLLLCFLVAVFCGIFCFVCLLYLFGVFGFAFVALFGFPICLRLCVLVALLCGCYYLFFCVWFDLFVVFFSGFDVLFVV